MHYAITDSGVCNERDSAFYTLFVDSGVWQTNYERLIIEELDKLTVKVDKVTCPRCRMFLALAHGLFKNSNPTS